MTSSAFQQQHRPVHVITLTDGHAAAQESDPFQSELLIALELDSYSEFWNAEEVTRWSILVGGDGANAGVGTLLASDPDVNRIMLSRDTTDLAVGTLVQALQREKGCIPTCHNVEDSPACVQSTSWCDYNGPLDLNVPEKCPATCNACPPKVWKTCFLFLVFFFMVFVGFGWEGGGGDAEPFNYLQTVLSVGNLLSILC